MPFVQPTIMGLVLTYLLTLGNLAGMFLRSVNEVMRDMNSVERIQEYLDYKDHEADWDTPKAPKNWPENGVIEAKNVKVRYRKGLPLVLCGVDFTI